MKIKSIRKVPATEPHYDITVREDHTFFANGVLTHNCNTSAQNAIIVGVHRGLDEVDELDIIQEAGRAGRFGMSPVGNVFLICDSPSLWRQRIANPKDVESQLLDTHALAFHLCAEIRNNIVTDYETLYKWYERTLAYIQKPLTKEQVQDVLNQLQNWGAIRVTENDTFQIMALGKVSATMYIHPEDCHHYATSFKHIANNNLWHSDLCLAYAIAAPTMQLPYIPKKEEPAVLDYMAALKKEWGYQSRLKPSTLAMELHDLLGGSKPTPQCRTVQYDSERISATIGWILGILRVNKPEFVKTLPVRIRYGCSRNIAQLCMIPGIGTVKANKLALRGITTLNDVIKNPKIVQAVVGEKAMRKTIDSARLLMRTNSECDFATA